MWEPNSPATIPPRIPPATEPSISTGLDRIHEIRKMATEDQEDAGRRPMPDIRGEVEFEDISFEYNARVPVLKRV